MSYAVENNLRPVLVLNPDQIYHNSSVFKVKISDKNINPTIVPTTNASTTGGTLTFNVQPPSINTSFVRQVLVKYYAQVVKTGLAGTNGTIVQMGTMDAPREWPITKCMNQITVTLNGAPTSLPINQIITALGQVNQTLSDLQTVLSLAPNRRDTTQNYNDVYIPSTSLVPNPNIGIVNSALTAYGETMGMITAPRGSWPVTITDGNNPNNPGNGNLGQGIVTFSSMEPLITSPFFFCGDGFPIIGINNFVIQVLFGDLTRMWSCIPGGTVDGSCNTAAANTVGAGYGLACTLPGLPEVHIEFHTPSAAIVIPSTLVYEFVQVDLYPTTTTTTIAPGGTWNMVAQNAQLTAIPDQILIYACNQQQYWTYNTTDTFMNLQNISITFDNLSGINASCVEEDLCLQSIKNGWSGTWQDWHQGSGSLYILKLGKNLTLLDIAECPSMEKNKQFSFKATFKNINNYLTYTPVAYSVVFTNGIETIKAGFAQTQRTVMSETDVINCIQNGGGVQDTMNANRGVIGGNYTGGNIIHKFGKLVKGVKGAINWAQKHHVASKVMNIAEMVDPALAMHPGMMAARQAAAYTGTGMRGRGDFNEDAGDDDNNRQIVQYHPNGPQPMSGGAAISQAELRKRSYENMDDNDQNDQNEFIEDDIF